MYEKNDNFINQSRKEANDVKACFTTFSFQAIAFSTVILGAIIKFQMNQAYVCFASIPVIIIVLAVCRIGNYKFATANRHNGFELYLDYLKNNKSSSSNLLKNISWEMSLRVWRIVQSTIFSELLYTKINTRWWSIIKRWNYNKIKSSVILSELNKKKFKNAPKASLLKLRRRYNLYRKMRNKCQHWFDTGLVTSEYSVQWYPGRYLHSMQKVLETIAVISLFPLLVAVLQFQLNEKYIAFNISYENITFNGLSLLTFAIFILTTLILIIHVHHINTRRKVLESGILSIHSCSVIWQVVSVVHNRAIKNAGHNQNIYLENISRETKNLKGYATNIYKWVNEFS